MNATEVIEELKRLIEEHGDLPVVNDQDESVIFEYSDDGEPVLVVW